MMMKETDIVQEMRGARVAGTGKRVITIDHGKCYDGEEQNEVRASGKGSHEIGAFK